MKTIFRTLVVIGLAAFMGSSAITQGDPSPKLRPKAVSSADGLSRGTFEPIAPGRSDSYVAPDALMFGGSAEMASAHVYIRGLPYGPLDLGTNLSVVMSDRPISGTRAGVGPNGIAATSAYYEYDAVNFYNQAGSAPPLIVASSALADPIDGIKHAVTFAAGKAFFDPPLTPADVSLLRPMMHVRTNAVGRNLHPRTSLGVLDHNGVYRPSTYGGQLLPGGLGIGWAADGSWIAVDGWVVTGSGNRATDQVPSTNYDTVLTNLRAPAVFIGVYDKAFNANIVCNLSPLGQAPSDRNNPKGNVGGQVTACEGAEWDLMNFIKQDYLGTLHGLSIQSGSAAGAGKLSNDSYNLHLGGPMPHQLVVDELAATDFLLTNSSVFNGNAGPSIGTAVGTLAPYFEMQKYSNGALAERVTTFLRRDVVNAAQGGSDAGGTATHSVHTALIEGGTKGDPATGTVQSQVVQNGPNLPGGYAICPYGWDGADGSKCPFYTNKDGLVKAHRPMLDLRTPASSSDPCVAGEYTDDTSFHYVCVSNNKWRRVALSEF